MNFLQLCQRLRQETGISDSGPSNVTGQVGDMKRLVDWVQEAWVRIQSERNDWGWMWQRKTATLPSGAQTFDLGSSVGRLVSGTVYVNDRLLREISYQDMRKAQKVVSARMPSFYAKRPDGIYEMDTTVDGDSAIEYECYSRPAPFVEAIDVPAIPDQYHMMIVWLALIDYALFDEAPELYQKAKVNYDKLMAELAVEQMPEVVMPGAIA